MHNKIFAADNAVAIVGGRNLGETYFGQSAGTNFVDIDLLAAGRVVRDLSHSFDQYWNNPLAYPVQSLMTEEEIEALKPQADNTRQSATGAPNTTSTARVTTSSNGVATTLPALPDSTDLRLLTWTWAPSVMGAGTTPSGQPLAGAIFTVGSRRFVGCGKVGLGPMPGKSCPPDP